MAQVKLTEFLKMRLKNREIMRRSAKRMDDFRQKYGKPQKGFHSVEMIRKMRDAHS